MSRPRDHGVRIGLIHPGPSNAITDLAGVRIGHVTVIRDEPDPPAGRGIARTGVTAIVPGDVSRTSPVRAGAAVLNGAGELTPRSASRPSAGRAAARAAPRIQLGTVPEAAISRGFVLLDTR